MIWELAQMHIFWCFCVCSKQRSFFCPSPFNCNCRYSTWCGIGHWYQFHSCLYLTVSEFADNFGRSFQQQFLAIYCPLNGHWMNRLHWKRMIHFLRGHFLLSTESYKIIILNWPTHKTDTMGAGYRKILGIITNRPDKESKAHTLFISVEEDSLCLYVCNEECWPTVNNVYGRKSPYFLSGLNLNRPFGQ